jgi:hypothetical protein
MKSIVSVGILLATVAGIVGVVVIGVGLSGGASSGLSDTAAGFIILGSDFAFIVLLALLKGVADVRDLLMPPAPVVSGVSPTAYPVSNHNQAMTIDGSNFRSGASLTFVNPKGMQIESAAPKLTFVSSSQLIYQFNNGGEWEGTWSVVVNNPGGQSSNPVSFTVTAPGK